MKLEDLAHLILAEATVLAADINPALRALDDAAGGYPSTTPMAGPSGPTDTPDYNGPCNEFTTQHHRCGLQRPCPEHDLAGTIRLTPVEAGSQRRDQAATDLNRLDKLVRHIQRQLAEATDIAHRHATVRIDDTTVATRLAIIDADIWCANCAQHGHRNVRTNGRYCAFCSRIKSDFKKQYDRYPNKQLLDIHATRGRVSVQDVHRAFAKNKPVSRRQTADLDAAQGRSQRRIAGAS